MSQFPPRFTSATPEVQTEIVLLGLKCWDILEENLVAHETKDLTHLLTQAKEEGFKDGKRAAQRELESKLIDLESETLQLHSALERESKQRDASQEETKRRFAEEYQRKVDLLVRETRIEERETLQKSHTKELQTLRDQLTGLQIEIAKLQAKENWEEAFYAERKERESLQLQIQDLTKSKTSYELGKEGEEEIYAILGQIAEWDFDEVHKEPGKADFRAKNKESKIFILDSKKYTNAIPKKERDKIIRDVDNDNSVSGGILVSLNSKVQTKDHCEIELTPTKKPICYLVLEGMNTEAKKVCLQATLRLLLQYVASTNQREKDDLLNKIQQAFLKLGELKSETENQRNKAKDLYESLKLSVDRIQRLLSFLQDKPEEIAAPTDAQPKRGGKKKGVDSTVQ